MELKKTFIAGKMNKDLDERLVPEGEFIDALNVTIDTTSGSNIGSVVNSLGNTLVTDIQTLIEDQGVVYVGSNAKTIGAVTFEADNLIYWLVTSDTFDAIFEYNEIYQFTSIVLLCTEGQLNFNKNYPVTGINFIPITRDEGPFIYWTDGLNPPRRINVSRCKGYATDDPKITEDINVILRPPLYSPKIDLSFDNSIDTSNNIQEKFIYFSYRFKYKDNQYSSLAPFSSVAFHANKYSYDYNTGDNIGMINKYNKVDVTVDTGNEFVEELQILYFDTYKLNVYVIDNYNKEDLSILDNSKYFITFSANKIYIPLESSEVTMLFHNVPLSAKAQEIIGNRLVYGNYVQFRDIVNANGVKIIPDYTLGLKSEGVLLGNIPKKSFRSDRDYEIGIIYTDEYGRMTTALTSKLNTLYIPPLNSDRANSIQVTLNNQPPFWATNYRFAIKQSQGDYYNIFPRTFVVDGLFRYFLINESDRDKITVGGYIIFKTANNIATYSSKQFKILELEYKQVAAPFTIEGLYFKINSSSNDYFLQTTGSSPYLTQSTGRSPVSTAAGGGCIDTINPIKDSFNYVNPVPVYYSATGNNKLPLPFPALTAINIVSETDRRIAIKIVSQTQFQWTSNVDLTGWSASITIPSASYIITIGSGYSQTDLEIQFDADGTNINYQYTINDIFIFNVRGFNTNIDNSLRFTGTPILPNGLLGIYNNISGANTVPPEAKSVTLYDYNGHSLLKYDGVINSGANIEIEIIFDRNPSFNNAINTYVSSDYYVNLEEWFWNEGYSLFDQYGAMGTVPNIGADAVTFRNGLDYGTDGYPGDSNYITQSDAANSSLFMCIRGLSGALNGATCGGLRGEITASLQVSNNNGDYQLSAETVPIENDVDIFYEMRKTYRIEDGNHMVSWPYADFTDGSTIFPSIPQAAGKTILGPLNPNAPTSTDLMHSFNVGERIYVKNTDVVPPIEGPPDGYYNILYVTDYAIVIDFNWIAAGPVTPGNVFYQSWETDQDFNTTPLNVELNNATSDNSDFNAFAFGNGVESYRIYDNYLRPTMKYSPRATSIIEDYKQEDKIASLCYSGIYKGDTSANRLNSFNLSQANFKNLDKQYGPIQKLYALDTNLMVLQQDKITSVLYGKNLLVDAVGGGQVASVPEVLGNQLVHPSEYGISNNPESFAKFSNVVYFTDARRGAVLQMSGDQVIEISANGMKNYFRDELKDSPNTQKLGTYDPYNDTYVLSFTDVIQGACDLSISQDSRTISPYTINGFYYSMFSIMSNTSWSITLEDTGDGINWLLLNATSGYGDQNITSNVDSNDSTNPRSVDIVIEYCNEETITFVLTQGGIPRD
jgi:hypothetical protein